MHKLWHQLTLGILLLIVIMAAGKLFGIANEATAGVTALYATLVFFQLREMRLQREHQEEIVRRTEELERQKRPILTVEVTRRPSIVRATRPGTTGQTVTGLGLYITLTITNVGLTTALRCQPVLTKVGRLARSSDADPEDPEEWVAQGLWIALPLLWSLDEPIVEARGLPTSDRDLVPRRPYMFDLGGCSTFQPDVFGLRVAVHPFSQTTSFLPGRRCFEVTIFSENADPVKKWIDVRWDGGFVAPSAEVDDELILHPPMTLISKLQLDDLAADPFVSP